jgi:tetratricopeptide (TPR) repeat protein
VLHGYWVGAAPSKILVPFSTQYGLDLASDYGKVNNCGSATKRFLLVGAATTPDFKVPPTMADSRLPSLTPEQRRVAAGQFEHANQAIAKGNFDYGIDLLLTCCKLDPTSFTYRKALRQAQKAKHDNNQHGSRFALLTTSTTRVRLKASQRSSDHLKVLEYGEQILVRNPWDVGALMAMGEAFDNLGLLDLSVWTMEQARHVNPKDANVNRALARLYEKRGNFTQAIALWELVRKAMPTDQEAQHKSKDLAACDTIARGGYESSLQEKQAEQAEAEKTKAEETTAEHAMTEPEMALPAPTDRVGREAAPLLAKLKNDPTNRILYLQLASIYRRGEQVDKARFVLQRGLELTGNHFDLGLELADLDIEPFRRNLALTEQKLAAVPGSEELTKIRTRLLKEINTRELDLFRQRAERYPAELGHRFELGVRLLRAGQLDEAIRTLQAVRVDPRLQWKALMYLGICFKSRNNWRLAQRNFEDALQSLPPAETAMRKELLFQLAQGSAEAGDLARAVELGYELANLDFGFHDIGRLLDEWQSRMQQA